MYNQETEGFRTDVRVCNLSYLQTDWYIDQMKRQAYDSPAVPIEWSRLEYVQGHNEGVAVRPEVMESINNFYKQNPEEAAKEFGDNPYELKKYSEILGTLTQRRFTADTDGQHRHQAGQGGCETLGHDDSRLPAW